MKEQQGYLLVSVAFIVLLSGFIVAMVMQMSNASHQQAMTAFTDWRVKATTESAAGGWMAFGGSYNASKPPYANALTLSSDSQIKDNKVKIIRKVYKLDLPAMHLSPYFSHDSLRDLVYVAKPTSGAEFFPELATNIRELHFIGFPTTDMRLYEQCIAEGYKDEVTIAPKADVNFDENPMHTLSFCLRSKGSVIHHYYQINYGLLAEPTDVYSSGTSTYNINKIITVD